MGYAAPTVERQADRMTSTSYTIVLEPDIDGGFIVHVPAFPEICTEGDTEAEAMAMAKDAIELVIASRRERGEDIPVSYGRPVLRDVIANVG
jgi:antitoxin HicB